MTPQERRKWLEDIERRLGIGQGAGRIYLRDAAGTWFGDAPLEDMDDPPVMVLDFVEPGDVREPEPETGPALH